MGSAESRKVSSTAVHRRPPRSMLGVWPSVTALVAAALAAAALATAAAGCRAERRAADPPGPRIEGERIVYPEGAVELASLSTATAEAAPAGTVRTTGRLAWDEDRTARVFPPVGGRVG